MPKRILFDHRAREALRRGVDQVADALRVTLGPRGRNVIFEKGAGAPTVTNDGMTIAREITLPDPFENAGAQLVREVSQRTNTVAGDGTTTATVLAQAILQGGLRAVAAGANPMQLKRGVDRAVAASVEALARRARPLEGRDDVARVATVSANGDAEIGRLLADAMERVGRDGVITLEDASGMETRLRFVEGMQLDKGYVSAYFVTAPESMEATLEEPRILLHDQRLSSLEPFLPILQKASGTGKPFLVIAEEVEGEALAALVVNKLRGVLASCAVRAPAYGERRRAILEDLAILTGATLVSEETGRRLADAPLEALGGARRVVVTRDTTTIVEGEGQRAAIDERVTRLRREIEETESEYDREKLQERLARLIGGVAVIEVGAPTEIELAERRARVEDALAATRAAVEEGIVPGGGVALLGTAPDVERLRDETERPDERRGVELVLEALAAPARAIAENAGAEGGIVLERLRAGSGGIGFNALTGAFEDLVAAGVVDPAKVVRVALQNAASIGGLLLTAETLVVERPEQEEENDG